MTTCRFGDIILVPIPLHRPDDHQKAACRGDQCRGVQQRPARSHNHGHHQPFASGGQAGREQPVAGWQRAGLLKPSVFKPILATIENTLVLKQLGTLQDDDRHTITRILQDILGTA